MRERNFKEIYLEMTPEERAEEKKLLERGVGYYTMEMFMDLFSYCPKYSTAHETLARGRMERLKILTDVIRAA